MQLDDIDRKLGACIRNERENRGWSLTDLSLRAAVSRAMINKIERGESSPTAKLLGKLSGAFGLSMSMLLARAETTTDLLLRHGDQTLWIDPETGYLRRQVSPHTDMPVDLVEITLPAGKEVPMPASAYSAIRQLIWVRDGQLTFVEGPVQHHLDPGDCLRLGQPSDCIFRNDTQQSCTYAVIVLRDV
ncbi:XRE family transcriptional regulator [Paracoccus sp. (in: a-proteobacteria)]|uniref:helix-turn-helix domain-containing protein n=1 Tax=Paracoccus sp. TaxID=267 RepID=UPI00289ABDBA|nr:XRE family transcriptional regulator [Paracoccus sp. (in: a-proteobacteria)]